MKRSVLIVAALCALPLLAACNHTDPHVVSSMTPVRAKVVDVTDGCRVHVKVGDEVRVEKHARGDCPQVGGQIMVGRSIPKLVHH